MKMIPLLLISLSLFAEERYLETLYPEWGQSFEISKMIDEQTSEYWDLKIFENPLFGKVLAIDGTIQTTEADEAVYHEMMAHVPLLTHPCPETVLIIGGGDGGLLREVLRHPQIKQAVLVEIDEKIIEISKRYLPTLCQNAFEDPRTQVVIQDGCEYVKNTPNKFDVILCDSTDPIGSGQVLFTEEFYGDCKRCLNPGGIFVNQNGVPFLQPDEITLTFKNRSPHFRDVTYYIASIPSYAGGLMAFGWASDADYEIFPHQIEERLSQIKGTMHYYNSSVHIGSFLLPEFIIRQVRKSAPDFSIVPQTSKP